MSNYAVGTDRMEAEAGMDEAKLSNIQNLRDEKRRDSQRWLRDIRHLKQTLTPGQIGQCIRILSGDES